MDKYAFGNRLYALRTEKGYTQEKLGKMLGVSNKAISKWENGTTQPRLEMLDKIAACFDISVEELLEYGDPEISYDNDGNSKKELNTNAVTEISKLPKISMKMISGLGFLRVDAQQFIKDIKAEKQLTNKDIAIILGITERTVGLYENGLKKPSAVVSAQMAAFYYNNSDDNKGIESYINTTMSTNFISMLIKLFLIVFTLVAFIVVVPILLDDECVYEMYKSQSISEFSIKIFLIFLLPISTLSCASLLFLRYVKLNQPEIKSVFKPFRIFLTISTVYIIADCLFFSSTSVLSISLTAFSIFFYIIHFINTKLPNIYNLIIRGLLFLIGILVFLGVTDPVLESAVDSPITPNISYDEILVLLLAYIAMGYAAEFFLFETYCFYETIKPYFPPVEKEKIKLKKKDIIIAIAFIVLVFVFFVILEYNKEVVHAYFLSKVEMEETTTLLAGLE